jgi:calcium/calmodulin-dependent protein kinase (CaM kinase) II
MSAAAELLELNRRLLAAVAAGDWNAYRELVAEDITCFEPEARGHLVAGRPFPEFYFTRPAPAADGRTPPAAKPVTTTMAAPVVKLLSDDVALVAYVRLTQTLDDAGKPVTRSSEETRLWQKQGGRWRHVHFHRSLPSA